MRVTINLDDDALEYVDQFVHGLRMSRGRAASELIRRGYNRPLVTHKVNGLHVVTVAPDSPKVDPARLNELEEEYYREEAKRKLSR